VSNRQWTPDELRLLVRHHGAGWSITGVACALGRSNEAVTTKARQMRLLWRGREQRLARAGTLADEIEAAKREMPTSPLFRPGDRV
jgi:hypothetical protein